MNSTEVHKYVCDAFDEFERQHRRGAAANQSWDEFLGQLIAWVQEIDQDVSFGVRCNGLSSQALPTDYAVDV
jgi:hypothetical protein